MRQSDLVFQLRQNDVGTRKHAASQFAITIWDIRLYLDQAALYAYSRFNCRDGAFK
ncbi:Uncharacterised protein [Vibrio cholerae]|uniref:Uncharacterized protein n=1 Tax=Vibrio cholerae TaxID=666 RepID=A0A656APH9_VIBCL|nr:Uncharacterised protein [Vibrio cholerae]CSD24904.1 Uncharacterised protein [Vibrio cholerae]